MNKHKVKAITPAGSNLFEDLGFDFTEAANMKLRAGLAVKLIDWIKKEKFTQAEAAERLGVNRPEISNLQRGRIDKFSIDKLVLMLQRAGKSVTLKVA